MTRTHTTQVEPQHLRGLQLAAATAVISGVSVFVNSYGVKAVHQPAVYTTAKNLVAALLLAGGAVLRARGRRPPAVRSPGRAARRLDGPRRWAALAYVGIVGGGLAFVLFFDGLASTAALPAAFLRDTLVIWVALIAVPSLGERLTAWNLAAIGLLVAGQAAAAGGVGHLVAQHGELLVLLATLLWAGEVVVAKLLLADLTPARLGLVRMGVGGAVLVAYVASTGRLRMLVDLRGSQLGWVLLTGALLAGYVATWMSALARARAVDVTSVLVASVVVTALLDSAAGLASLAPQITGLALVALGGALVAWRWPRAVPA